MEKSLGEVLQILIAPRENWRSGWKWHALWDGGWSYKGSERRGSSCPMYTVHLS